MSSPNFQPQRTEANDFFSDVLDGAARFLLWGGLGATVLGLGFLVFTFASFAGGGGSASPEQAISNIQLFEKLLIAGSLALGVGTAYSFWGEETLGFLQLVGAAALFFAPLFLPSLFGGGMVPGPVGQKALGSIQLAGTLFGLLAIGVTSIDIAQRVSMRSRIGSKADQLKYGKGIKEEEQISNVFMGKCWQLPFCRKFVRERCPIFHARKCCWREKVGCMCEESVIREAMSGRTIPKDQVTASKYIPKNNQLTLAQKHQRCVQCVIYNEHQKHKYKLVLPLVSFGFIGGYFLFRPQLLAATTGVLDGIDRMIGRATFQKDAAVIESASSGLPFQELLLICFIVVIYTYALKLIEFAIFKLKI